jgi:hypothetical protein
LKVNIIVFDTNCCVVQGEKHLYDKSMALNIFLSISTIP